jgi:hypothetical protein
LSPHQQKKRGPFHTEKRAPLTQAKDDMLIRNRNRLTLCIVRIVRLCNRMTIVGIPYDVITASNRA